MGVGNVKIGIYGGSFNPPHLGHIRGAVYAKEKLGLDKLLLIPAGLPPHKELAPGSPTAQQRLEMVRLAAEGIPGIEVSDMELRRAGKSYTYQTVEALHEIYPSDQLTLIMGTDMYLCFENWTYPERICAHCELAVLYRGEKQERQRLHDHREKIDYPCQFLENPITDISSTQIRRMLRLGCAGEFLSEKVAAYIQTNGLYRCREDCRSLSEAELEKAVVSLLAPSRVAHVLGCRDTAVALAKHYGADPTDAARAALLHDITKALDGPLQLTLARAHGIILDEFSEKHPKTLHALTGSWIAEHIFGENKAVVEAIRWHTTGKANMNLLEKIIYVADYMEPNRDFPGVDSLRELAWRDITQATRMGLEFTLAHLKNQGSAVSPESRQALQHLMDTGHGPA